MPKRKAPPMPESVREWFRQQGARGGKIGAPRRQAKLSPEHRSELARKAALARWAKKRKR
jgi:hypothetical protein